MYKLFIIVYNIIYNRRLIFMKLTITHHAKVRWFERFHQINDKIKIENEIEYNFKISEIYKKQNNDISIYKNNNAYFVIRNKTNERIIITAYPINNENDILINSSEYIQKYTENILYLNESFEIQIYRKVLDGELKKFPLSFWKDDIGGEVCLGAKECTIHLFKHILKWKYIDIITKSNKDIFIKNKLSGMVSTLFSGSWHLAIWNAYPDIKPYILKNRGNFEEYWRSNGIEKSIEMGIWLTEELRHKGYKFTNKNVLSLKWDKIFKEYKLKSMITIVFNNDLVKFFNTVFNANITEEDIIRYNLSDLEIGINRYEKLQM